jgi:3-oxoadipate enol-lactonase
MKARINGITMNYEVEGAEGAPAVVLHHPLATDLSIWDELVAELKGDYRLVRFDARGHGATDAPAAPYDFDTLTRDVVALMDHLKIAKAGFIGVSMGGMIGQHLAFDHGDRFDAIMLVATSSRVPDEAKPLWRDRVVAAREQGMASQVAPALQRWVAKATMEKNPALVARLSRMIEATPLEGYAGWCAAIGNLNVTERLQAVKLPVAVVVGAEDAGTPPAAAEVIHKNIPGSTLRILPGVAHQLHVEDAAAFNALAREFLDARIGA